MTVHDFDWPDRVVVGTVGPPGRRTFYLQVRTGGRATSVVMEKQQAAALADLLDQLLDDVASDATHPVNVPAETPPELVDDDPLDPPDDPLFRTGAMRLGWDPRTLQVVVEAYPSEEGDDERLVEPDEPGQLLKVRMPVGTARAFVQRTRRVVEAGRPTCPLCGLPVDPEGHVCPLDDA